MKARAGVFVFESLVLGQSEAGTGEAIRKNKGNMYVFHMFLVSRFHMRTVDCRFVMCQLGVAICISHAASAHKPWKVVTLRGG